MLIVVCNELDSKLYVITLPVMELNLTSPVEEEMLLDWTDVKLVEKFCWLSALTGASTSLDNCNCGFPRLSLKSITGAILYAGLSR